MLPFARQRREAAMKTREASAVPRASGRLYNCRKAVAEAEPLLQHKQTNQTAALLGPTQSRRKVMTWIETPSSSNIARYKYDDKARVLTVNSRTVEPIIIMMCRK